MAVKKGKVRITISIDDNVLKVIDSYRHPVSRSVFVEMVVTDWLYRSIPLYDKKAK